MAVRAIPVNLRQWLPRRSPSVSPSSNQVRAVVTCWLFSTTLPSPTAELELVLQRSRRQSRPQRYCYASRYPDDDPIGRSERAWPYAFEIRVPAHTRSPHTAIATTEPRSSSPAPGISDTESRPMRPRPRRWARRLLHQPLVSRISPSPRSADRRLHHRSGPYGYESLSPPARLTN